MKRRRGKRAKSKTLEEQERYIRCVRHTGKKLAMKIFHDLEIITKRAILCWYHDDSIFRAAADAAEHTYQQANDLANTVMMNLFPGKQLSDLRQDESHVFDIIMSDTRPLSLMYRVKRAMARSSVKIISDILPEYHAPSAYGLEHRLVSAEIEKIADDLLLGRMRSLPSSN